MPKRSNVRHIGHNHPQTSHYYALCRKQIEAGGEPLDMDNREAGEKPAPTRKRKGTASAKRKARTVDAIVDLSEQATGSEDAATLSVTVEDGEVVDAVLNEPLRNSRGRFTRNVLVEWENLLSHIEGAETFLFENGIELEKAVLTTHVGGRTMIAEFNGHEWTVETVE